MKMAKASERDIDAAGNLMSLLGQADRGDFPNLDESNEVPDFFDVDSREHLRAFYDAIMSTLEAAPGYPCRVIGGMCYVIMFDKNEIIDPASDTLDLHPKIVAALAVAAAQVADKPAAAPVAPQGYKTVPIALTDDMAVAFAEVWCSKVRCIDDCEMDDAYAAMLDAAPVAQPAPRAAIQYAEDPMDLVRTLVCIADRMKLLNDEQREHYPSPLADYSPLMIGARNACVERGFTEGGLSISSAAPANTDSQGAK